MSPQLCCKHNRVFMNVAEPRGDSYVTRHSRATVGNGTSERLAERVFLNLIVMMAFQYGILIV